MFDINKLIKSSILDFSPYQSARKINTTGSIWLNANESPFDCVSKMKFINLNRYPEPQSTTVLNKYAVYSGVKSNEILITRGADEGIDLLIKTFCNPIKDNIIFCSPTYDMYKISSKINSIKSYDVPMLKNWELDLKNIKLLIHNTKIIFICRPNNPTGHLLNKNNIIKLLKIVNNNVIVVIDEAYIEFCIENTLVSLINRYPNLVILRTLSKAFGLAGLRCGFTLANKVIITLLNKIIAPYPTPTPVSNIASESLCIDNINLMKNKVFEINKNRKFLLTKLSKLNCIKYIFPSKANYILVKFDSSQKIFEKLLSEGIVVRNQDKKKFLKDCLRISIGSIYECSKLITTLENL